MMIAAIRYPNIELVLTAQTKENAALLLKDKYNEIIRYYPMIQNEIAKTSFIKGDALILLKNGARIDCLVNAQSSKGQRRKRISIEESNLLDNVTFEDAVEPIVEVGRITYGKLVIVNPEELNQQINFYTTPGFRGSESASINAVREQGLGSMANICELSFKHRNVQRAKDADRLQPKMGSGQIILSKVGLHG